MDSPQLHEKSPVRLRAAARAFRLRAGYNSRRWCGVRHSRVRFCNQAHTNLIFCSVIFGSWLGGVEAGIFSILLSVIALDYYFLPPIYALGLTLEETPDMILFVTAGLFVSWLNRDRNVAKEKIRRAKFDRNSAGTETLAELGKAEHSSSSETRNGHLPDEQLIQTSDKASGAKCRGDLNEPLSRGECYDEAVRGPGNTKRAFDGTRESLSDRANPRFRRDCVFSKRGEYWAIEYEGQTTCLKATRGLECLVCLLGHPGREFHVRDLVGPGHLVRGLAEQRVQQNGHQMRTVRLEAGNPILDSHAKAEYKLRLAELRAELQDAERSNDADRAEKIQRESDAIAEQLAAAVGLGGRDRKAASQAERARTTVTKRIRGSIKRIAKAAPSLGRHLAVSIKTGYFCSYNPDPECCVRRKLGS
jgi:uncharacterized protein DUF4118